MKTYNVLVLAVKLWLFSLIFTLIDLNGRSDNVKIGMYVECNSRVSADGTNWFNRRFSEKNTKDFLYINYKQAYGIRFDPNSINRRYFQSTESTPEDAIPDNSGIGSGTIEEMSPDAMPSEASNSTENSIQSPEMEMMTEVPPTTVATSSEMTTTESSMLVPSSSPTAPATSMASPTKRSGGSFPFLGTVKPLRTNNTNAVQPTSSLRQTLNLLKTRLKQMFKSGLKIPISHGERFLSVFNVINLENVPCTSTQPMITEISGICYEDYDCSRKGGTAIDTCADGFGVCCICKNKVSFVHECFLLLLYKALMSS